MASLNDDDDDDDGDDDDEAGIHGHPKGIREGNFFHILLNSLHIVFVFNNAWL